MRYVIPTEIAAPIMAEQNKYARNSTLRTLLLGIPKILKKAFLPTIATMMVEIIQQMMENVA